jgi:hypothetical protein
VVEAERTLTLTLTLSLTLAPTPDPKKVVEAEELAELLCAEAEAGAPLPLKKLRLFARHGPDGNLNPNP